MGLGRQGEHQVQRIILKLIMMSATPGKAGGMKDSEPLKAV